MNQINQIIYAIPGWGFDASIFDCLNTENKKIIGLNYHQSPNQSLTSIAEYIAPSIPDYSQLLGWSFGGLIAIKVASLFPKKIKRLILLASQPNMIHSNTLDGINPEIIRKIQHQLQQKPKIIKKKFIRWASYPNTTISLDKFISPASNAQLLLQLQQLADVDLSHAYQDINCNITCIINENDQIIQQSNQQLQQLNPLATILSIAKHGHTGFISDPKQYQNLIFNSDQTQKIKKRFNRAATSYDQYAIIQQRIAHTAIMQLKCVNDTFNRVADLACGTGNSTQQLINHIQCQHINGFDLSDQLLAVAKKKYLPSVKWIELNFNDLPNHELYDLLFCNMGLQWSNNIYHSLVHWRQCLSPSGMLLFSIPLNNNFPEIQDEFKRHYPCDNQIQSMIKDSGYQIISSSTHYLTETFKQKKEAWLSLHKTGVNYHPSHSHQQKGLKKIHVNDIFKKRKNNETQLTYHIGIYLVVNHEQQ